MIFGTDLAIERKVILKNEQIDGVEETVRGNEISLVTEVKIVTDNAVDILGKPKGRYITVEVPPFSSDFELLDGRLSVLVDEIRSLLPPDGTVLAVGLGNRDLTADALGPLFADGIFATRHIDDELKKTVGFDTLRSVAAISPGVLGRTGIEAFENIKSVAKAIKPACIIAVDALAAMDMTRLGTTVQLSDTGISPGSGVGNRRHEISEKTLGIPVIAVGVPTVISAFTLTKNVLENINKEIDIDINNAQKYKNYIVASREADLVTKRAARLLSLAVNLALQPSISVNEMAILTS